MGDKGIKKETKPRVKTTMSIKIKEYKEMEDTIKLLYGTVDELKEKVELQEQENIKMGQALGNNWNSLEFLVGTLTDVLTKIELMTKDVNNALSVLDRKNK